MRGPRQQNNSVVAVVVSSYYTRHDTNSNYNHDNNKKKSKRQNKGKNCQRKAKQKKRESLKENNETAVSCWMDGWMRLHSSHRCALFSLLLFLLVLGLAWLCFALRLAKTQKWKSAL